jgi:hypothetical protein
MRSFVVSLAAAALVVVVVALPAPAATTTLFVYPDADAQASSPTSCPQSSTATVECNLSQAVALANASSASSNPYQIDLESNTAHVTFNGPLQITAAGVTIDGSAVTGAIVTAGNGPIISVAASGVLGVQGLTVTGGQAGFATGIDGAGGIANAGYLTLNGVTVSGNTGGTVFFAAGAPGGIGNSGTLVIIGSTIEGNTGGGGGAGIGIGSPGDPGGVGGILNTGLMSLSVSTVTGNQGGVGGPGSPARAGHLQVNPVGGEECVGIQQDGGDGGPGGIGGVYIADGSSVAGAPSQVHGNTGGAGGAGGPATLPGVDCGADAGSNGLTGAPADIREGSPNLHWTTAPPSSAEAGSSFSVGAVASGGGPPIGIGVGPGCTAGPGGASGNGFGQLTASTQVQVTGAPGTSCTVTASVSDNGWFAAQSIGSTGDVQIPDDDLAITASNLTVNATGPTGTTVNYTTAPTVAVTVTDEDASPPAPVCSPLPGTVFAIGTTTVNCSATDSEDTNSPVTTSFTVTVVGATGQLTALQGQVKGVGPGTSLAAKLAAVQGDLKVGAKGDACGTLTAFIAQVKSISASIGKTLANQLIAEATQIKTVLRC